MCKYYLSTLGVFIVISPALVFFSGGFPHFEYVSWPPLSFLFYLNLEIGFRLLSTCIPEVEVFDMWGGKIYVKSAPE